MFILCLRPCKKQIKRLNMKHLYTIQHIFLGELAQVIARSMESISAKPIMNGSAQKMIDKFSIPQVKYRQSLTTDRFRNPILLMLFAMKNKYHVTGVKNHDLKFILTTTVKS